MLCEVLILLVVFVADKSLFLRKAKPTTKLWVFLFSRASEVYFRKRLETKDQMCAAHLGFALQVPRPGSTELIPFLSTIIITSESDWKQETRTKDKGQRIKEKGKRKKEKGVFRLKRMLCLRKQLKLR